MYFPKKYNNELKGLVAQLNKLLGDNFFKLTAYNIKTTTVYELIATEKCIALNKLSNLSIDVRYEYSFRDMKAYLNGLIRGIKINI